MNFKIILLAASALLMGACGNSEQDIQQEVGSETAAPEYVYGDESNAGETPDMIEGDSSEVPNDNPVVDTPQDTDGSMQDGSPETMDETTPQ